MKVASCGGSRAVTGIAVLDAAYLIPFKAKAWMDLTDRRSAGEQIGSRNVKKQKNDVYWVLKVNNERK